MPTIDQLAQATAAADTDEIPTSQNGVTRKLTRRQLIDGLQAQLAVGSGTVLGRGSAGTGAPEQIALGANLVLNQGTLSATASPYVVSRLPAGTVPGPADLVPVGQQGANAAIPYAQFVAGLSGVSGVDGSGLMVTPAGTAAPVPLGTLAAQILPITGGQLTGPLTLAADPAQPSQAATRRYVDQRIARSGDAMTGPLVLAADPTQPLQAATKSYVDGHVAKTGDTMTGPLSLPGLTMSATTNGPTQPAPVQITGNYAYAGGAGEWRPTVQIESAVTGSPNAIVMPLLVSTNSSVSGGGGGVTSTYLQAIRSFAAATPAGNATIWASIMSAVDETGLPSSTGGRMQTLEVDIQGNGVDDVFAALPHLIGGGRVAISVVAQQQDPNGTEFEVGTGISFVVVGGAHYRQMFLAQAPFSGAVLNTVNATPLAGANTIWLGNDQTIAFDNSGQHVLRWNSHSTALEYAIAGKTVLGVAENGTVQASGGMQLGGSTAAINWDSGAGRYHINAGLQVDGLVYGVSGATFGGAVFSSGFAVLPTTFSDAILDAKNAQQAPGANAIWLADGHTVAFDTAGNHVLSFDAARGRLVYRVNGAPVFSVDAQGNIRAAGTVTANTTP